MQRHTSRLLKRDKVAIYGDLLLEKESVRNMALVASRRQNVVARRFFTFFGQVRMSHTLIYQLLSR
jgi:hypothetical protein